MLPILVPGSIAHRASYRSNQLIPFLSLCLSTSEHSDLTRAAQSILTALSPHLAADDPEQTDIGSYLSALGFPSLLECASFDTFVALAQASPQQTREKLHYCGDLLTAFVTSSTA